MDKATITLIRQNDGKSDKFTYLLNPLKGSILQ